METTADVPLDVHVGGGPIGERVLMLPVDVVFLHIRRSAATEERIRESAEALAALYPSIISLRAVVEQPHKHHAIGKRFRVRLEIGLPRREDIVVERGPAGKGVAKGDESRSVHKAQEVDGAFTDLTVVLHEVFAAATKRLKTIAARRRSTARKRDVSVKAAAGRTATAKRAPRRRTAD